jgi:histidyl-tRNA synthetase
MELLDGPPTPGVGWASGVDRILLLAGQLPTQSRITDLYVAVAKPEGSASAFQLAREARQAGLRAQLELTGRSLKGQLKHADRVGARYVAIVGNGTDASLKQMDSGDQRELTINEVIPTILGSGDRS